MNLILSPPTHKLLFLSPLSSHLFSLARNVIPQHHPPTMTHTWSSPSLLLPSVTHTLSSVVNLPCQYSSSPLSFLFFFSPLVSTTRYHADRAKIMPHVSQPMGLNTTRVNKHNMTLQLMLHSTLGNNCHFEQIITT